MALALEDPLIRFRSSMGGSVTDRYDGAVTMSERGESQSPSAVHDGDVDEDDAQLLKLIDEATHAVGIDDEPSHHGGSFIVTASASQTSFALPPPPQYPGLGQNMPPPFAATAAPLPPPPPTPPSFAETMAVLQHGAGHQLPQSPVPFGSSPTPSGGGAACVLLDSMVVRNTKGVFLLHPVQRHPHAAATSPMGVGVPGTPTYPPPPQYVMHHSSGQSPPVSPLPSYALPPPLPPMGFGGIGSSIIHSHSTPLKKGSSPPNYLNAKGVSPPNYAAPPPYRSPAGKN